MTNSTKKAWHISFVYDMPTPAIITLIDETSEGATEKLRKMLDSYNNVQIYDCEDIDQSPILRQMFDREQQIIQEMEQDPHEQVQPTANKLN